ncbi:glutathione S-transferase N-terminal domain-containing protein [Pseudomonas oryzihabitans]|uniref:glutathione S-transferase N-terminal domain-containing protein n=1 Tax=Pseudomonas oryzihabitans TaxID=47885 RepID=UPI003EB7DC35
MIRLHHLDYSRSHRVLWLLEELGLPYELVRYPRTEAFQAPEALKRVHPLGKSPVLEMASCNCPSPRRSCVISISAMARGASRRSQAPPPGHITRNGWTSSKPRPGRRC